METPSLPHVLLPGVPLDSQVKIGEISPYAGPERGKSNHSEINPEHSPQQSPTHQSKKLHQS